jgi:hypothetical protein
MIRAAVLALAAALLLCAPAGAATVVYTPPYSDPPGTPCRGVVRPLRRLPAVDAQRHRRRDERNDLRVERSGGFITFATPLRRWRRAARARPSRTAPCAARTRSSSASAPPAGMTASWLRA